MSKTVRNGNMLIGGGNRVLIQSMTNTDTADFDKTLGQIFRLKECGCDIIRLAVTNPNEVKTSKRLLEKFPDMLVADIQFDYKLAIACSDAGFPKIRINPGNIGDEEKIKELARICNKNGTIIRVGSNSGSIEEDILVKYGRGAEALVESAMRNVKLLEKHGFDKIVISAKSSDVKEMIKAYRILNDICDYPLHIGVTESGSKYRGMIKSSIGIGALLADSIGDTIRVSLSSDPEEEVRTGKAILQALGYDKNYCEIVSCPTCSRCKFDLFSVVDWLEKRTANIDRKLKIAVMGCVVNGPGEAEDADFGIAGGDKKAAIFRKGRVLKTIEYDKIYEELEDFLGEYTS